MYSEFSHLSPSRLPIPWPHSYLPYLVLLPSAFTPLLKFKNYRKGDIFSSEKAGNHVSAVLKLPKISTSLRTNPHKIQLSPAGSVPFCASLIYLLLTGSNLPGLLTVLLSQACGASFYFLLPLLEMPFPGVHMAHSLTVSTSAIKCHRLTETFMVILYCNLSIQPPNPHSLLLQCSLDRLKNVYF